MLNKIKNSATLCAVRDGIADAWRTEPYTTAAFVAVDVAVYLWALWSVCEFIAKYL